MRIIGGALKGKKLCPLRGLKIRPTTDYQRESIFNILSNRVEGAVVLDLFAGTGSLGMEALSRGATSAVFVDNHRLAMKIMARNFSICALEDRVLQLKKDIIRGLGFLKATDQSFDLVFMDPPYDKGFVERTLCLLDRCECIAENACIVIEHSYREALPRKVARFEQSKARQHGNTLVSFYEFVL
jgi:16S rRNA (guanine966-N2)-methyltransferase